MKKSIILILGVFCVSTMLACNKSNTRTSFKAGHTSTTPSIDCEVTSGPNKGKKGKRTEDGWCEGDWGSTECKPRSKCKDVASSGIPITGTLEPTLGAALPDNPVVGIRPPFGSPTTAYCRLNGMDLSVIFVNSGGIAALSNPAVTVSFGTSVQQQNMPNIPANSSVTMVYTLPERCFNPDCEFTIKWSNQRPVEGICIG